MNPTLLRAVVYSALLASIPPLLATAKLVLLVKSLFLVHLLAPPAHAVLQPTQLSQSVIFVRLVSTLKLEELANLVVSIRFPPPELVLAKAVTLEAKLTLLVTTVSHVQSDLSPPMTDLVFLAHLVLTLEAKELQNVRPALVVMIWKQVVPLLSLSVVAVLMVKSPGISNKEAALLCLDLVQEQHPTTTIQAWFTTSS